MPAVQAEYQDLRQILLFRNKVLRSHLVSRRLPGSLQECLCAVCTVFWVWCCIWLFRKAMSCCASDRNLCYLSAEVCKLMDFMVQDASRNCVDCLQRADSCCRICWSSARFFEFFTTTMMTTLVLKCMHLWCSWKNVFFVQVWLETLYCSNFTVNKILRTGTRALHKTQCFLFSKLPLVLKGINRKCLILQCLFHI